MLNEKQIIEDYKKGLSIAQIAKDHHVALYPVSAIISNKGLPCNRLIIKSLKYPDFKQ